MVFLKSVKMAHQQLFLLESFDASHHNWSSLIDDVKCNYSLFLPLSSNLFQLQLVSFLVVYIDYAKCKFNMYLTPSPRPSPLTPLRWSKGRIIVDYLESINLFILSIVLSSLIITSFFYMLQIFIMVLITTLCSFSLPNYNLNLCIHMQASPTMNDNWLLNFHTPTSSNNGLFWLLAINFVSCLL